jgi:DNA polymerase-3 subunit gamma/tau
MQNEVLYRKWRPKSLKDILGQKDIVEILSNAILNNRLSHSFVFSGPSGTGKTSTARVFAKSINCENSIKGNLDISKCECLSCSEINNYSSQTVVELDAASSIRQVEDLTEVMIDKINFLPGANKYKVYILDEVHMLSRHSFNALLKTLEEPPKHLITILVTTDPEKIPQTIMSRCQILEFKSINTEQISNKLVKIATSEKRNLSFEDSQTIALHSDGSLRNAENLLEKCLLKISDKNLSKEKIENALGLINSDIPLKIIENLMNKNIECSIKILNIQFEKNSNFESIINSFRQLCRNLLHYKYNLNDEENIKKLGERISVEKIKIISIIVNDEKIKTLSNQQLALEIMILEIYEKLHYKKESTKINKNSDNQNEFLNNTNIDSITNNINIEQNSNNNESMDENIILKKFIDQFKDLDWSWKVKSVNNYNISENTINLLFTHQSQIDYINQEISNPIKLQLFRNAIKFTWNKDLQFNLTLKVKSTNILNKSLIDKHPELNNHGNSTNEVFYKEAAKYGRFNKFKEINNES